MKIRLVELRQIKILNSEGTDWSKKNQYTLSDRILYGCKETLVNQLV